jgi:LacI family transcriptional regulator
MDELGYRPNRIASGLSRGATKVVGFVIPDITNLFFTEIVRGANHEALSRGYHIFLCNTDGDMTRERSYMRDMLEHRVGGLVWANCNYLDDNIPGVGKLGREVPYVLVDSEIDGADVDVIVSDNVSGGYQATGYLAALGHNSIAVITGPKSTRNAVARLEGARKALEEFDRFNAALVRWSDFTIDGGYLATTDILSINDVDAIFACNDLMALGALRAIEESGRSVPGDVSLVGFDDISICMYTRPKLTTVHQPAYEIGQISLRLLIDRIEGVAPRTRQKTILPVYLVVRESARRLSSGS